jgi:hypothetical protein
MRPHVRVLVYTEQRVLDSIQIIRDSTVIPAI